MKQLMKHYDKLIISGHAMDEFSNATHLSYTPAAVYDLVMQSKLVKYDEILKHGYSSSYYRRQGKGIKTWYAKHKQYEWDMLFVMTECADDPTTIVVVTVLHQRCSFVRHNEEAFDRRRQHEHETA